MPNIFQMQIPPWVQPPFNDSGDFGEVGIFGALTPTVVPSGTGAVGGTYPGTMYHVTVTPAAGAGTYTVLHGLPYSPTAVIVVPRNTQGVTPTLLASVDWVDTGVTDTTKLYINVSGNGTYDVWFG